MNTIDKPKQKLIMPCNLPIASDPLCHASHCHIAYNWIREKNGVFSTLVCLLISLCRFSQPPGVGNFLMHPICYLTPRENT